MGNKIKPIFLENQFGFQDKICTKGKSTYTAFVDIEKAFDNVNWSVIFKILKRAGIAYAERKLIFKLYYKGTAIIKIGEIEEKACIRKRVRQRCTFDLAYSMRTLKRHNKG